MKRTGFKRPEIQRKARPALVLASEPARAVLRRSDGRARLTVAIPKRLQVRSESLRLAYRLIPCQWEGCAREDGTVCCAHSNLGEHGKGKSQKADDNRGASLCFVHHQALDQGATLSRAERRAGWEAAHKRSVFEIISRNLWPKDVPVPADALDQPLANWFRNKIINEYEVAG